MCGNPSMDGSEHVNLSLEPLIFVKHLVWFCFILVVAYNPFS